MNEWTRHETTFTYVPSNDVRASSLMYYYVHSIQRLKDNVSVLLFIALVRAHYTIHLYRSNSDLSSLETILSFRHNVSFSVKLCSWNVHLETNTYVLTEIYREVRKKYSKILPTCIKKTKKIYKLKNQKHLNFHRFIFR